MAKARSVYVCTECGYETQKWLGKCPDCGSWNSLEEKTVQPVAASLSPKVKLNQSAGIAHELYRVNEIDTDDEVRFHTGLSELDRVLGGGIVKGSVVLLGGDPGIGKSTLLLQICEHLGQGHKIVYVSGEESVRQLKLRAVRLNVNSENLHVLASTDVESICSTILTVKPDIVMIDSIQTMCISAIRLLGGKHHSGERKHKRLFAYRKERGYTHFHCRSREQGRRYCRSEGA